MGNEVKLVFAGDATKLNKTFDDVGGSSTRMVSQIDKSSDAHVRLGEKVGNNEAKFRGTADLLDGLGGAFGLPTEGATKMMRSMSDLSGGFEIVSGIMPAVSGLFPKLAGGMTLISAHPLMAAILIGGAIIGGLILLEKKTGLVSDTVKKMGEAFMWAWDHGIKPAINLIIGGINLYLDAMTKPFELLGKIPGAPGWMKSIGNVQIPKLDVGGTVLQTGIAVVHRGEFVTSAGGQGPGTGTNVTVIVNGSVTSERGLVDAIHSGLLDKQRRGGSLGLVA